MQLISKQDLSRRINSSDGKRKKQRIFDSRLNCPFKLKLYVTVTFFLTARRQRKAIWQEPRRMSLVSVVIDSYVISVLSNPYSPPLSALTSLQSQRAPQLLEVQYVLCLSDPSDGCPFNRILLSEIRMAINKWKGAHRTRSVSTQSSSLFNDLQFNKDYLKAKLSPGYFYFMKLSVLCDWMKRFARRSYDALMLFEDNIVQGL